MKKTTTTKKAAPKKKAVANPTELDKMVELFLQKREKKKVLEAEENRLKEAIEKEVAYQGLTFDDDGEIKLSTGKIKEVASAPALVWAKSGKSLTPVERENMAAAFPEQYRKLDLNAKLIAEVMGANHDVAEALGRGGMEMKSGTSWQVKSL